MNNDIRNDETAGKKRKRVSTFYGNSTRKRRMNMNRRRLYNATHHKEAKDVVIDPVKVATHVNLADSDHENTPLVFNKLSENISEKEASSGEDDTERFNSDIHQMSELEKQRKENMQKNFELFQQFGIGEVKEELLATTRPKKNVFNHRLRKATKEATPRRTSLRIRKIEAESVDNTSLLQCSQTSSHNYDERKPKVIEMVQDSQEPNGVSKIIESWNGEKETKKPVVKVYSDHKDYKSSISSLQVRHCAKVTYSRICSLAVHPTTSKTIAAFGDKWGHIGIWDVGSRYSGCDKYPASEEVILFQPHCSPVSCLKYSPVDCNKLFSCSYDGTIRQGDFTQQIISQIFAFEDEGIRCLYFAIPCNSPNILLAGNSDGEINLVDTKSGKCEQTISLSNKAVKCVDCHPTKENLFVTVTSEGLCATWDMRMLASKKQTLSHFRSSNTGSSAFFSPKNGDKVLYTSLDNNIRVFDINQNGKFQITPTFRISHDNHTGRWLTPFRATWDPNYDSAFVVGSMGRPRKVDVFNCVKNGVVELCSLWDDNFASVTSVNAFHPTRNILACGNSSGKAYVWN